MGTVEGTFIPQITRKLHVQNVCLDEMLDEFEYGSPVVMN